MATIAPLIDHKSTKASSINGHSLSKGKRCSFVRGWVMTSFYRDTGSGGLTSGRQKKS